MPKSKKLHPKGKPTSIQKVCNEESAPTDPEEAARQFQLELCWCIQELERTLNENKGNEKQLTEIWKILQVLKNNNQPTIRKRQLMRTHFGDYRAKMAAEEKKLTKLASKMKISESPAPPKATFLRKSAFMSTGDSSFRFNFALTPEQMDKGDPKQGTEKEAENKDVDKEKVTTEGDLDKLKFSFSGSDFRFNFNSDSTGNS